MSINSQQVQDQFRRLQQVFHGKLPERMRGIDETWNKFLANQADVGLKQTLHAQVHSLIGTAGTFGAEQISAVARALDDVIKSVMNVAQPLTSDAHNVLLEKYDELKQITASWKPE